MGKNELATCRPVQLTFNPIALRCKTSILK